MAGAKKYTVRHRTATPETHAQVSVVVTLPGSDPDSGGIEDVDVALVDTNHHGSTGRKGTVRFSGLIRAGGYLLRCKRPGYGPSDGQSVVKEGPVGRIIRVAPLAELPAGISENQFHVTMDIRHPKIHVHVARDVATAEPVPNVHVSISGQPGGNTDSNGEFLSAECAARRTTVEVWHETLVPTTAKNGRFTAVVEPRTTGVSDGVSIAESRDIYLDVQMSSAPSPMPPAATNPVRLWIDGGAVPFAVDEDPRLPSPGQGDTPSGQDGWDMRLFHGMQHPLSNLVAALDAATRPPWLSLAGQPIGEHQVTRLAISAHGDDGVMDIEQRCVSGQFGFSPPEATSLTTARFNHYRADLLALGRFLAADSIVLLCSCRLARTSTGEMLLKELSLLWPTTRVVGLRTFGSTCTVSAVPRRRPGASGLYPGIRDSRHANHPSAAGADSNTPSMWADLGILPWFSESSLHATVALDGNIIRRGDQGV